MEFNEAEIDAKEKEWKRMVTFRTKYLKEKVSERENVLADTKRKFHDLEKAFYHNLKLLTERDLLLEKSGETYKKTNEELQNTKRQLIQHQVAIQNKELTWRREVDSLNKKLKRKVDHLCNLKKKLQTVDDFYTKTIEEINKRQKQKLEDSLKKAKKQEQELQVCLHKTVQEHLKELTFFTSKFLQEKEKSKTFEIENQELKDEIKNYEKSRDAISQQMQYYCESLITNKPRMIDVGVTTMATYSDNATQTLEKDNSNELNYYKQQNEMLKQVIKEMKRNPLEPRDISNRVCYSCVNIEHGIKNHTQKMETEIEELKRVIMEDRKEREDENLLIDHLDDTIVSIKEKLFGELQQRLEEQSGGDINEVRISLLQHQLNAKFDILNLTNRDVLQMIENLKNDIIKKIDENNATVFKSEHLLPKIRQEILMLEERINKDSFHNNNNNRKPRNK